MPRSPRRAGRRHQSRRRSLTLLSITLMSAAVLLSLTAGGAGAHGDGITVDCEKVTAAKPLDAVKIIRADGYDHTVDVNSTLVFVIPPPDSHGRVTGVLVTFDDGLKADRPVPECPATTTNAPSSTTTVTAGGSSTSTTSTSTSTSTSGATTTAPAASSTTVPTQTSSSTTFSGAGSTSTTPAQGSGGSGSTAELRVGGVAAAPTSSSPTATNAGSSGGGASLPFTGTDPALAWLSLVALGSGGAMLVSSRRRR